MRFMQIKSAEGSIALINSQHISHISVRVIDPISTQAEDGDENKVKYLHEYPVYRVTMFDGQYYEIEFPDSFPDLSHEPFRVLMYYYPGFRGLMQ